MKKAILLLAILSVMSCKKDEDPAPYNTSPTKNPAYNGIHCTDQAGNEIPCPA